jgi:porin
MNGRFPEAKGRRGSVLITNFPQRCARQNAKSFGGVSIVKNLACAVMGASAMCAGGAAAAEEAKGEAGAVQFSLSYVADVTGVVDGGLAQRGRFLDNLDLVMDVDLERTMNWRGASAHVDVLNNSGGMPNEAAGTLQGVDNIEVSSRRLRLFEAWIEQSFGSSSLRLGLYDLNSEFYANDAAGYLIAPAFGVGSEIAATGSNGPSIFPSTALAARYHVQFDNDFYARGAILNADAGVLGDPGGVDFSFDGGALVIAEGGIEGARKLAIGAWRYTERQDNIRNPVQSIAQGAYIVFEQPLNDPDAARAARAFVRAGVSDGDTTPFAGGWQAGVLIERVFEGRPDSVLSFGVNQGMLSEGYRQNQIDLGASMSDSELQVEITYSDKVCPHLTVQPDLQWVRRPSGDRGIEDAFVAGLRVSVEL